MMIMQNVSFLVVKANDCYWSPCMQETGIANAWYEVLSVLHLMAMLCLSEANSLLIPKTSSDGYQPRVLEGGLVKHHLQAYTSSITILSLVLMNHLIFYDVKSE